MNPRLVLIDADVLGRRRTGDETYVSALLRELPKLASDIRFAAVTRRPDLVPDGVEAIELPARSQPPRMAWSLPRLLRRIRPEVGHFQHVVPPRFRGRSVVTIHDLSFEQDPSWMGTRDRFVFKTMVPRSAKRADRIVTVSERTKQDVIEHYAVDPSKVVVIPNGIDPQYRPNGTRHDGRPYLLFVGALQPRKDPLVAVEALELADPDLRLVVVGPDKGSEREMRRTVERLGLGGRVDFAGHVERDELASLYRGASALVFPSRYEGFGLPVVEAMACGTPVVAAAAGAVPEIAGDAAVLVEPGDAVALAGGIERALADRERLVAAGLERVRRFSWAETARLTLAVYRELL